MEDAKQEVNLAREVVSVNEASSEYRDDISGRNVNRGFKKLRVWQDGVNLYVRVSEAFSGMAFIHGKVAANTIDAAHSIVRNISEGYCRRSLAEYLRFLDIARASSGELHGGCFACLKAGQISEESFQQIEDIHFRMENGLLRLIESLERKKADGTWQEVQDVL